jgi:hypothetical protein
MRISVAACQGHWPHTRGTEIQTPAESTAGVTPTQIWWPESTPERYGAKGDGVADDYQAWVTAIAVNKAGGARVVGRMTTYRISGGLVIDPLLNDIDLGGATLDFSAIKSGSFFSYVSSTGTSSSSVYGIIKNAVRNGFIKGGAAAGVSVFDTASGDATKANYFLQAEHLGISNVRGFVTIGTNSFELNFSHIAVSASPGVSSSMISIQPGGANYGERIVFDDVGFHNCDAIVDAEYGNCDLYLKECSFDYPGSQMFKLRNGARATCSGCHFESSLDTSYWFDVAGANSRLRLIACQLYITGSRGRYALGNSASDVGNGGIEITQCDLNVGPRSSYGPDFLISGTGRTMVQNLMPYGTPGDYIIPSAFQNALFNSSFASSDLAEYALQGTAPPTIDDTKGHADGHSLKLNPAFSDNSSFYVTRRCQPGEVPVMQFYYQATRVDSDNPCTVSILFCPETAAATTMAATVLATGMSQSITTSQGLWTRARFQSLIPAPAGTRWVLYQVSLPAGRARTLWIDDLAIA